MLRRRYCHDPYRELELYLQQTQDEIGKEFESLLENNKVQKPQPPKVYKRRTSSPTPVSSPFTPVIHRKFSIPEISTNTEYQENFQKIENTNFKNEAIDQKCNCIFKKLPPKEEEDNLPLPPSGDMELLSAWVDNFVKEVNITLSEEEDTEVIHEDYVKVQPYCPPQSVKGTSSRSRPLFIPIAKSTSEMCETNIARINGLDRVVDAFQELKEVRPQSVNCSNIAPLQNDTGQKFHLKSNDFHQIECDGDGQDAVTQTTPQLSRSSSITGVTECSEDIISISSSGDSIPRFSSSSSSSSDEFQTAESSSSSSCLSSDEETRVENISIKNSQGKQDVGKVSDYQRTHSTTPPNESSSKEPCQMREVHSEVCLALPKNVKPGRLLMKELNLKSSSAPLLETKFTATTANSGLCDTCRKIDYEKVCVPTRSHSVQELTELEAVEACSWLRAAGFPQYAQMYEDNLFPIDISSVQKDHEFLDTDSIQSLFRRLNTLNKCAKMKIDNVPRKSFMMDDSDEEDFCALSENWQFQRSSRRWSRIPLPLVNTNKTSSKYSNHSPPTRKLAEDAHNSSHDSVFIDDQQSSPDSVRKVLCVHYEEDMYVSPSSPIPMEEDSRAASGSGSGSSPSFGSDGTLEKQSDYLDIGRGLRRTGSERLKESAKALLRRMESLRGKRKKKNRHAVVIGGPQGTVDSGMMTGTDHSQNSSVSASPQLIHYPFLRNYHLSDDIGPADDSDCSQNSTPQFKHRKRGWKILNRTDLDFVTHSDSECHGGTANSHWKDTNINEIQNGTLKYSSNSEDDQKQQIERDKSYLLSNNSQHEDKEDRLSVYDNVPAPLAVFDDVLDDENRRIPRGGNGSSNEDVNSESVVYNSDHTDSRERRDSGVGSSLTRCVNNGQTWWHCFPHRQSIRHSFSSGLQLNSLSAPQLMILRKLSLLKLTTLMEKYSPSSRTGWNWAVPKFIKKIRTPDYKDKVVFGVPLLLILQRSGEPLPNAIQSAICHLQKTSLDCTGLFRKSGVRSRIQKLRNLSETSPDSSIYENQQAYDIADMLKQYFRELPEALLTNKLSEIFLTIFQHIPEELRKEATQAAILLMPDENREVLQSVLAFLQEVSNHSDENQMTCTNLAVCFAPSLFHLNIPRSASASPRRSKVAGVPDQRELNENRAAHECLTHMIKEYKSLFTISEDILGQCRSLYLEEWEPATLEDLGKASFKNDSSWKAYVDNCVQGLLKEARDKFKSWVSVSQNEVDIAYKKLNDRHPLRLWKVSVEVEAPPIELLNRILRERHIWDDSLIQWRVVSRLDKQSEIFQYLRASLPSHPPRDYCVLRSWQTDLPKGTCVLIGTSVEHADVPMMLGAVRGVALASHYLIEPCGSGKSRVTCISRIDARGRTPEWYNKAYGQICALEITRLKNSFLRGADGPETKV